MAWFQRLAAAISREYDRRIRRASQITDGGAQHSHDSPEEQEEDDAVEIVNLPRGAAIAATDDDRRPTNDERRPTTDD